MDLSYPTPARIIKQDNLCLLLNSHSEGDILKIFLKNIQAVLNSIEGVCYEHFLNENVIRWFGNTDFISCKIEDMPGTKEGWLACCHPDDKEDVQNEFNRAVSCQDKFDMTYRWSIDGLNYRWFRDKGIVVQTENGPTIIGTMSDISGPFEEFLKTLDRIKAKSSILAEIQESFKS